MTSGTPHNKPLHLTAAGSCRARSCTSPGSGSVTRGRR